MSNEALIQPLRCYIAGVQHESSSFSPIPTSRRAFTTVRWGVDAHELTLGLGYGESCDIATEFGWDVIAGPCSLAQPSRPAPREVWELIRDEILEVLVEAGGVDIVWLCLHGAQMASGRPDCEGELLAMVRAIVGDEVAVGTLLDLHTNLSSAMLDAADLVVSCREYPHTDYAQRAAEMLPALAEIRRGAVRPTTAAVRFTAPGAYPTTEEPMTGFNERLIAAQELPRVLLASANHGFEGSDHDDVAASIVVTTDDDLGLAESLAQRIADDFRSVILGQSWVGPGVEEAVAAGLGFDGRPVVIADRADNAGGGAAGDSTFVLAELLRREAQNVAVALLWDPIAVGMCHDVGVGATLPLRIGGKCGPMSGDPIDVEAEVLSVRSDSSQSLYGLGDPNFPIGRTAAIRVGGIEIVMATVRTQVFSRHVFTDHGIDPLERDVLVVKSTQHFMNDFGKFAAHVIRCDGPGTLTADLSTLPYRYVRRPMLGLDAVDTVELEPMAPVERRDRRHDTSRR